MKGVIFRDGKDFELLSVEEMDMLVQNVELKIIIFTFITLNLGLILEN